MSDAGITVFSCKFSPFENSDVYAPASVASLRGNKGFLVIHSNFNNGKERQYYWSNLSGLTHDRSNCTVEVDDKTNVGTTHLTFTFASSRDSQKYFDAFFKKNLPSASKGGNKLPGGKAQSAAPSGANAGGKAFTCTFSEGVGADVQGTVQATDVGIVFTPNENKASSTIKWDTVTSVVYNPTAPYGSEYRKMVEINAEVSDTDPRSVRGYYNEKFRFHMNSADDCGDLGNSIVLKKEAADKKAAEEKVLAERAAAEKKAAEEKTLAERAAAEKKAAEGFSCQVSLHGGGYNSCTVTYDNTQFKIKQTGSETLHLWKEFDRVRSYNDDHSVRLTDKKGTVISFLFRGDNAQQRAFKWHALVTRQLQAITSKSYDESLQAQTPPKPNVSKEHELSPEARDQSKLQLEWTPNDTEDDVRFVVVLRANPWHVILRRTRGKQHWTGSDYTVEIKKGTVEVANSIQGWSYVIPMSSEQQTWGGVGHVLTTDPSNGVKAVYAYNFCEFEPSVLNKWLAKIFNSNVQDVTRDTRIDIIIRNSKVETPSKKKFDAYVEAGKLEDDVLKAAAYNEILELGKFEDVTIEWIAKIVGLRAPESVNQLRTKANQQLEPNVETLRRLCNMYNSKGSGSDKVTLPDDDDADVFVANDANTSETTFTTMMNNVWLQMFELDAARAFQSTRAITCLNQNLRMGDLVTLVKGNVLGKLAISNTDDCNNFNMLSNIANPNDTWPSW